MNLIATPAARDWKGKTGFKNQKEIQKDLESVGGGSLGLKLQPNFVEWVMGFPQDWTKLEEYPPNPRIKKRVKSTGKKHRLKALGNAVVPQVVYQIFKSIDDYDKHNNLRKGDS